MKRKMSDNTSEVEQEHIRKKARIESSSSVSSPIEIPELLSRIIMYALPSSSSILYLCATNKRSYELMYQTRAWKMAGFNVLPNDNTYIAKPVLRTILATHEYHHVNRQFIELHCRRQALLKTIQTDRDRRYDRDRDELWIQNQPPLQFGTNIKEEDQADQESSENDNSTELATSNKTMNMQQFLQRGIRPSLVPESFLTVPVQKWKFRHAGWMKFLSKELTANNKLTFDACQALFYVLSLAYCDISLDELFMVMDATNEDIDRFEKKNIRRDDTNVRRNIFPLLSKISYQQSMFSEAGLRPVYLQESEDDDEKPREGIISKKFLGNNRELLLWTCRVSYDPQPLTMFCKYDKSRNIIEECGDFIAYVKKHCPNEPLLSQLKHLLEIEGDYDKHLLYWRTELRLKKSESVGASQPEDKKDRHKDKKDPSHLFTDVPLFQIR